MVKCEQLNLSGMPKILNCKFFQSNFLLQNCCATNSVKCQSGVCVGGGEGFLMSIFCPVVPMELQGKMETESIDHSAIIKL